MNPTPFNCLKEVSKHLGEKFHLRICSLLTNVHYLVTMTSFRIQRDRFGNVFLDLMTSFWIGRTRFDDLFLLRRAGEVYLMTFLSNFGFLNTFCWRFQLTNFITLLQKFPINPRSSWHLGQTC